MRDFAAFMTLMACLVVAVASFVSFIKPLPKLGLGTRKRAFGGLGVAFGLFILTAIIIPSPKAGSKAAPSVAEKADSAEATDVVKASGALPEQGSASPETKEAAIGFYKSIFAGISECDKAATATAEITQRIGAGSASVYDGYSAATKQANACRESWRQINDIDIPDGLPDTAEDSAQKARETCANTALSKQMGAESFQEIFDGNMKPSKLEEAKERAETAQAGVIACAAGTMEVAMKAGVDLNDLPKIE